MAREHDDLVFSDPTPSNERPEPADDTPDTDPQTLDDTEPTQPEPGQPPAAEPDRTTPDEPDLPADVLAEATQLGIADAVRGLDPDTARYHIDLLRSTLGQLALTAQRGPEAGPPNAPDDPGRPAPTPPAAAPPRPAPPHAPPGPAGFALQPMEIGDFDPAIQAVAKNVQGLHDHYNQQLSHMQQMLGELYQAVQQTAVQAHRNEFDRYVTEASDFADTLGNSPSLELDPQSAEYQSRMRVAQQMDVLRAGYLATGHPPPSNKTLFLRACAQLFPQAAQQNARKELERRLRDQRGRFAPTPARAGTNGSGEATGDRAAFEFLRAQHARMTKG